MNRTEVIDQVQLHCPNISEELIRAGIDSSGVAVELWTEAHVSALVKKLSAPLVVSTKTKAGQMSMAIAPETALAATDEKPAPSGKLAKKKATSLKASPQRKSVVENIGAAELSLIESAASSGREAPVFALAGQAFLQGGQETFLKVVQGGLSQFGAGIGGAIGNPTLPDDFDLWSKLSDGETVESSTDDLDLWGAA
jgi:hypothetical protein